MYFDYEPFAHQESDECTIEIQTLVLNQAKREFGHRELTQTNKCFHL